MIARTFLVASAVLGLSGCEAIKGLLDRDAPSSEPVVEASGEGAPTGPQVSALPEVEPNDTAETAMRLPTGRPVAGALSASDVDNFLIPAGVAAATLEIRGEGLSAVDVFRPQDASGYSLPISGGLARMEAFARDASVLVTVRGEGDYTVLVADTSAPPACGFAREPDDIASPGVVLASVPSTGVGCIPVPNDLDVFLLPAGAWDDAPGFGLAVSAVEGLALDVRLKDANGAILARLSGELGEAVTFPNIRAPESGDLYIEVRSSAGANETEPYRLNLRRLPALNGFIELEPNDSPDAPTQLDAIGLVNGYIHRSGDVDHYRLTTAEPRLVRLLAEAPAGLDLRVEVTGGPLGSLVIDNGRLGEQEQLCSLRVDAATGFSFSVSAASFQRTEAEPYLLHFELLEGTNWEVEPNDTAEQVLLGADKRTAVASDIGIWLGELIAPYATGYTFPPGDSDRFLVEVFADPSAAATYKSVTISLEPNGQVDYSLELVDEDGVPVAVSNTGGVGEGESIALDLPAGMYLAQVSFVSGEPCSRPYRLNVRQTDFPAIAPVVPSIAPPQEGSGEGSGEPPAVQIDRPIERPRQPLRVTPPPTAPRLETRPEGMAPPSVPRQGGAPTRAPGEQPPTFGGGTGR